MKRTFEEYILLAVPMIGMIGVFPFVVLRFIRYQWLMGVVDAAIVLIFGLVALYVWKTRKTRIPSIVLTVFTAIVTDTVIYINGPTLIYWSFPTMSAAYFLLKPREAATVNVIAICALIPVISMNVNLLEFFSILITLILNNIFSYVFSMNMKGHQEKLATQATRDSLTGAGNRRLFDENVSECIAYRKRNNDSITLIMLDIDHFKKINDTFGHATGDHVLINLMKLFQLRLRESDGLYRVGGEEFAVLLKGVDTDTAVKLAEELRHLVEKSLLIPDYTVTISLGVAACEVIDTSKTWLERADSALYQAKNAGRNRTCV